MAGAYQIKALVRSHLDQNNVQFLSVAMQIAAYEARKGDAKLATELRAMIDETKARQQTLPVPSRAPTPIALSITTAATEVNLYAPVAAQVAAATGVEVG